MLQILLFGPWVFATTNLDDLAVLGAFFMSKYRVRNIVIGQLLGIGVLTAISIAVSVGSYKAGIPSQWLGLFGFIPIFLGLKAIYPEFFAEVFRRLGVGGKPKIEAEQTANNQLPGNFTHIVAVAGITIVNGGDNLGIYISFFSTIKPSWWEFISIAVLFALMTLLWCFVSYKIVHHASRWIGVERFKEKVDSYLPYIFISLGIYVLWNNGSILAGVKQISLLWKYVSQFL